jgi:hypothetical protein
MPQRIPRYVADHTGGAFLLLALAAAFAFSVMVILYRNQANETERLAKQGLQLSLEIQQQRRETIYNSCRMQNVRHLDLARFLRKQGIPPKEQPQVYVFIDKLAPLQNCREVVQAATDSS